MTVLSNVPKQPGRAQAYDDVQPWTGDSSGRTCSPGTPAGPDVRIAIVEDHALLAQSLALLLEAAGLEVHLARLAPPDALLDQLREATPDIVLLDLELGEPVGDGELLVRPLTDRGIRVLVVTSVTDRLRLASTLELGAAGYLCKSEPVEVLVEAVVRAVRDEPVIDPQLRHTLLGELRRHRRGEQVRRQVWERLTPREKQVLEALTRGRSVSMIAEDWCVSITTVRTQVRAILSKLGVSSQLEAVALAQQSGWLDQPASPLLPR